MPSFVISVTTFVATEAELGSPSTLILTGGAARFVEPLVFHPHIYDPNLLLKGLAFLYERNCAK